jgi:glycosyltransferase involved in cell wall biosynthesis
MTMQLNMQRPIRILHVVGAMNRGGIETWLMHILRHIDRDRLQMDFVVHTDEPGAYDTEIRQLGSQLIPCLHPSQPWRYGPNFKQILHHYGPYHVVHSHVHHFSGFILRLAKAAGVPMRIVHSHNDTSLEESRASFPRKLYLNLMRRWLADNATAGFAASHLAAANLLGKNWQQDPRWQTLYCGIDLKQFQSPVSSVATRAEFGIPPDAFVVGHVGRFEAQKNHRFLLQIATELCKQDPRMVLLLIGEGPLRCDIEESVAQQGLSDRIIFAGSRPDVPQLMQGAMDLFLLPSLYEGLGLVLIEAQAAGLPCLIADNVPQEAEVVKSLIQRISVSQSVTDWVAAVRAVARDPTVKSVCQDATQLVASSVFNIEHSVERLTEAYETYCAQY